MKPPVLQLADYQAKNIVPETEDKADFVVTAVDSTKYLICGKCRNAKYRTVHSDKGCPEPKIPPTFYKEPNLEKKKTLFRDKNRVALH